MEVPFLDFQATSDQIKSEILATFEAFFDSNYYVLGTNVRAFEKEFAIYSKVSQCIGVGSGLDALHLALKSLNIGAGDEVIVPSNTYIASVLAIIYTGATPIFVEPRLESFNIDPTRIEEAITKKTKAIMPVHLYGQACEMSQICSLADAHNLAIIEDNAQAQGAEWESKKTGSFGIVNAVSFYPSKNLGALGEAGAVTTDNEAIAEKIRSLRNYGSSKRYYNDYIGYNNRLDECQASFLRVKLRYLDQWNQQRMAIAQLYNSLLADIDGINLPEIVTGANSVYHLYVIRTSKRNELQEYLKNKGVSTLIHYPIPPHLQKALAYLEYKPGDFPIAEEIANTCLSIPLYIGLEHDKIKYVCDQIRSFFIKG